MTSSPSVVVLISGKRKSGKDFVAEALRERFSEKACIIRLSQPLKAAYAKLHGLDLAQLLGSGSYKEHYRHDMIRWGEQMRLADPAHFCQLAVDDVSSPNGAGFSVWIVSDCRRTTDLAFFDNLPLLACTLKLRVRIVACSHTRKKRGWTFEVDVDDAESECALDDPLLRWDFIVDNSDPSCVCEECQVGVDCRACTVDAVVDTVSKRLSCLLAASGITSRLKRMKGLGTSVTPLVAGVRTDCERLMARFIEVESVRFEHFRRCFKDMKFSLILSGRSSQAEYREFTQRCFSMALSFSTNPQYSFQARVGGLYLVYALYYLQSQRYKMKIRISVHHWQQLLALMTEVKRQQHFDTCFVFAKLVREQAFQFSFREEECNPLFFKRFEYKDDEEKKTLVKRSEQSLCKELLDDTLLNSLSTIHEQYCSMKGLLDLPAKEGEGEEHPVINIVQAANNPVDYVKSLLSDIEARSSKTEKKTATEPPEDSAGERRSRLKRKAAQEMPTQTRSRRHRNIDGGGESAKTGGGK